MPSLNTDKDKIKRLQWQCRRGMLEIDLLLKRYLSNGYVEADEVEQALFESLLTINDQQLFLWLMGKEDPSQGYAPLIEKLRN